MSMIMVRYFEYSMTAGLFLVSILVVMIPAGDAYMYQMAYIGMLMTNLVALPMMKAVIGAMRTLYFLVTPSWSHTKDDSTGKHKADTRKFAIAQKVASSVTGWLVAGLVFMLMASVMFFLAGLWVFMDHIGGLATAGAPPAVTTVISVVLVIYMLFAVVGFAFFVIAMATVDGMSGHIKGSSEHAADGGGADSSKGMHDCAENCEKSVRNVRWWLGLKLILFEGFNWGKWFVAIRPACAQSGCACPQTRARVRPGSRTPSAARPPPPRAR
mmetsp:Transcript_44843/g.112478  ORF Transcript_44843/g.112478 Transcript_44843/m.112478 type:complete len:270 (-) Transcript_44843:172-981(-)